MPELTPELTPELIEKATAFMEPTAPTVTPEITPEQVQAYLAKQAEIERLENERIHQEVEAWLAKRGRMIVVAIQTINGGAGAVPVWGIGVKR